MKSIGKLFLIFTLAIAFSLLAVAIPTTPVLAAERINLYPDTGEIGQYFTINGENFTPSDYTFSSGVDIYFTSQEAQEGDKIDREIDIYRMVRSAVGVDEYGEFRVGIEVPDKLSDGVEDEDVREGAYYVCVTYADSDRIKEVAKFRVISVEITLFPNQGEISEYFTIKGENFTPSDYSFPSGVDIYFTSQEAQEDDEIGDEIDIYKRLKSTVEVDDTGEFWVRVKVPLQLNRGDEDVHGGTYYVCVTYADSDRIEEVAKFSVIAARITLDTTMGLVGAKVRITGSDFYDNEEISIEYDGVHVDIASGDNETDSGGYFTSNIIIPESTAGRHTITVTDETGSKAEAEFTLEEGITATPTKGVAGDTIAVSGTGFGGKVNVTIKFAGDEVAIATTDDVGSFQATFTLPIKAASIYSIEATDEEKNIATAAVTVVDRIKLSQTTGNVGAEVTISGTGFRPNATVAITYAPVSVPVAVISVDGDGSFSSTFTVPKSQHGQHTITASDSETKVTTTFTVESSPPPVPVPQLLHEGDKRQPQAYFNWDDVDDPSGVTYTLQIATDDKFTAGSVVLEKSGLTESEYTLTKEERLKPTKKAAPCYWRIQAIDGAGNESGWATPGPFYVGSTFEPTGWVLYTLMGISGLVGLAIATLLLRRRTA
jgi:hypothetical protein